MEPILSSLRVGLPVLDLLVKKYGELAPVFRRIGGVHSDLAPIASTPLRSRGPPQPPQINLDQFVCACIIVQQMCQLYDQCSGYGASQISRDDFLRSVISLP